jgi:hypothetical protein
MTTGEVTRSICVVSTGHSNTGWGDTEDVLNGRFVAVGVLVGGSGVFVGEFVAVDVGVLVGGSGVLVEVEVGVEVGDSELLVEVEVGVKVGSSGVWVGTSVDVASSVLAGISVASSMGVNVGGTGELVGTSVGVRSSVSLFSWAAISVEKVLSAIREAQMSSVESNELRSDIRKRVGFLMFLFPIGGSVKDCGVEP